MANAPEISEENKIPFLETASTDRRSSTILVDGFGMMVEGDSVNLLVNDHDVAGAVDAGFGGAT